jgi:2-haloacid dehalogenase
MALEKNLEEFHITGLTEEEKDHWNHVWDRLKPWPDSVAGLTRLKKKYIISPLSNGDVALLTNLGKFGGLPWDVILSAELFKHYKPDHETYLMAAAMLGLKPDEVMLGAAHRFDLDAARECGLRTGFIYRPKEFRTVAEADQAKPGDYDVVATSMVDLAAQLGA